MPSCREIAFVLRTLFFDFYGVERQQRVDKGKANGGDDSGCDCERNALVHKGVFGCRDVNVIVASLQAGGVEFLVVDVHEVAKAICKLLVSQSYFGCFFPQKKVVGMICDGTVFFLDCKGEASGARLDAIEHCVDLGALEHFF